MFDHLRWCAILLVQSSRTTYVRMQFDGTLRTAIEKKLSGAKQLQKLFEFYRTRLESATNVEGCFASEEEVFNKIREGKQVDRAIARNATKRLRDILSNFTSREGKRLPVRAEIPPRKYGIAVEENEPFLKSFWNSYIDLSDETPKAVHIVYTEHLFYYQPDKRYLVRHMDANDPSKDIRSDLPFIPEDHGRLERTRHFVNSSEVAAVLRLSEFFGGFTVPVETSRAHLNARSLM